MLEIPRRANYYYYYYYYYYYFTISVNKENDKVEK